MAKKTGKTTKAKTLTKTVKSSPKKTTKPADTGTIGYRHLPTKKTWLSRERFKREKRPKDLKKLTNSFHITRKACEILWENRKLFFGVALIYGLLNLVLVQGFSTNTDIDTLKNELHHGTLSSLSSGVSIFAVLVGSAGNGSSETAGAYQLPLVIIASLAVIWSLRQLMSNQKIRIRDAYYKGMYPLIPFILVLLVMAIQIVPLVIGAALYAAVVSGGIAVGILEHIVFLLLFLLLAFWSLYMLCSSVFALYIVTLPDMTPIKALRSAKQLVKFRRLSIFRKILLLPVMLLIVAAIVMLPIIFLITALAQWVFFILTMLALLAAHTYIYSLYRELLNE